MSESLVPPILNPSSLYTEEAKRDATRIRIYNMVLQQIYNKVKAVARIPGNEKTLWYVVPEFIPGTPRFEMGEAVLYIVWNLRNAGYIVQYTHPNFLFISWKAHDEKYHRVDSPWSHVMNTARNTVASGISAPTTISHVTRSQPATTAAVEIQKRKTPLKKTVEFKPPDATLPPISNPSVASALYGSGPPQVTAARLPGQLSERHVSFV